MKHTSLLFLLLLIIVTSCTKNAKSDNSTASQLIPLAVGNEWHYVTEDYDTFGNMTYTRDWPNIVLNDTIINDTTWYTNFPGDSSTLISTANTVFSYDIVSNSGTNVVYKSTDEDSETIYQNVSAAQYGKLVAFNKTYNKNGYDVIKNVDSSFYNNSLEGYAEYYIKPGLGVVETDYYWPNYHTDGTISFYLARKEILQSYILH